MATYRNVVKMECIFVMVVLGVLLGIHKANVSCMHLLYDVQVMPHSLLAPPQMPLSWM